MKSLWIPYIQCGLLKMRTSPPFKQFNFYLLGTISKSAYTLFIVFESKHTMIFLNQKQIQFYVFFYFTTPLDIEIFQIEKPKTRYLPHLFWKRTIWVGPYFRRFQTNSENCQQCQKTFFCKNLKWQRFLLFAQ